MSSNKRLPTAFATGLVLALLPCLSHAASAAPSFDGAIAAQQSSAAVTAAPGVAITTAPKPAAPAPQPVAPLPGSETHLTLRDIDQLARNKVARSLGAGDDPGAGPVAQKPASRAHPEAAVPVAPAYRPARVVPVTFVGSFSDENGLHVLYEYEGAVYPARLGEKLLNGWVARKVDGLMVTVAQGKTTRTLAMRGGSQDSSVSTGNGPATTLSGPLRDLGAPLPAWIAPGTAPNADFQSGR